jgi:hypothetical protein
MVVPVIDDQLPGIGKAENWTSDPHAMITPTARAVVLARPAPRDALLPRVLNQVDRTLAFLGERSFGLLTRRRAGAVTF